MHSAIAVNDEQLPSGEDHVRTRVLVVDNDVEMIDLLKLSLEPGRFEVSAANSAQVGVELVEQLKPDVMVLDLLLLSMNNWELCKDIRKISQAPILVLSAIGKPELAARALDEGADDFILKPVTSSVLTAHLKKLARRARAEHGHFD
jgi:DNA-binding response OmpR family regulator